jgi:DNA polymerase-3 subunit alpha
VTDFVHLHCHSEYSLLDGMSTPEEIAKITSTNGQVAAAITDHGTMGGVLKFQDACLANNVKPLFGVEAYFVPSIESDSEDKSERFHLILLAKNNEGLKKLFKMNQKAWGSNFYYKPRIDFNLLEELVDNDVISLSGCMGSAISKAIDVGDMDRAAQLSERFIKIFKDDFYFEIQSWNPKHINDGLIQLADTYNRPVLATADCHFPSRKDKGCEEVLLMLSQYPSLSAADQRHAKDHADCLHNPSLDMVAKINNMYPNRHLRFDDINPYVAGADEVASWFKDAGYDRIDILENTMEVAEKCTARMEKRKNLLPKYMKSMNSDDYLSEITKFRLQELGITDEAYVKRLDEELGIIKQLGFADYFLIVWDLVKWADNNGIGRGTGRGSVGGSVMAFLLDITQVDPIKYNLLFARFINPERNDYPDIDLDFEDKRRDEVKTYLATRWGKDNVAAISIYGTFKSKSAVKDVARVLQVPFAEINSVTPFFETIDELKATEKGKVFIKKYPDVVPLASRLENRIRTAGVHAAGMVVSSVPLTDVCPVESRKDSQGGDRSAVTAFAMEDAEAVGLIKIDVLGLKTVSVIKDCLAKIQERLGIDVRAQSLKLDDHKVFENFNNINTVGIFQADAAAYRNLIERMGIDNFNDLVVSNALVRPGALLSQGQKYIDCKKGVAKPKYPDEVVREILEETYGTVIFQEQLMQMAVLLADFTWSEADSLRKIIGKKRDVAGFDKYKEKFVNNKYLTPAQSEKIWAEFEMSALYMFNKSHAVAYSLMSYQTMWLKINYPLEFIWALLYNESASDKITAYLMEAQRLGLKIYAPDINKSEEFFSMSLPGEDEGIRFGLANVTGCGTSAIKEITTKRPFNSFEEFSHKCSKSAVKAPLRENLDKVGAFESIGHVSQFDNEKYYLPILGFPIAANQHKTAIDEFVENADEFHETMSSITLIKAVVRSTKKATGYLRVEFEDHSGSCTVFGERNTELAQRDYVYALIGDRTLHAYCDVYQAEDSRLFNIMMMKKAGTDHKYSWLYEHGIGYVTDEKTLAYIFNIRNFITSSGKEMASVYCWDGKQFFKIVIFAAVYKKVKQILKEGEWYAVRLSKVEDKDTLNRLDSYKLEAADKIITVDDYVKRKNLVKESV